ncbi:MAG: protein translocase subunit SecF [Candidatus Marinimicrobia bacterium]|nr:protein translocase subunit SecF [Candidatus Neomarinimicrobiota bacterium]
MRIQPLGRLVSRNFKFDFIRVRAIPFVFSSLLVVGSLVSLAIQGLNFGIDFAGGVLVEVRSDQPVELSELRTRLNTLGLGDVSITTFGDTGRDVMIRVQEQAGGDRAQTAALKQVQSVLGDGFELRRTEVVGPKVGSELIIDGALAIALALIGIMVYVWLRFEWQFAMGAVLSLTHDVITTIGIFSIFQIEFNLNTVAAILTIAGFSINDTVVVYDRVREMMRKYKKITLPNLLNFALNSVLMRTITTTFTTALAVVALIVFGGEVLRGFSVAMLWGMIVGTYSTIYVALPVLVYFELRREDMVGTVSDGQSQIPEYERGSAE